ncbi:MAG TPA: hypothetical protein VGX69_12010 [Solirubrobacteraceae bacterium]|jgi:hypothetical protein|nr:hypothetical protein [Solirubrobacteraceae bacterium]
MEIRSYRRVFELERRIYRVDRVRLNPNGVPVRGVVYFLALLAVVIVGARLPVASLAARSIPWYARDVVLPGALAALVAIVRVDGRPFHIAAHALVRFRLRPRQSVRLRPRRKRDDSRWTPPSILMIPDGSEGRMRRFRYTGPGAVRVARVHELRTANGPLVGVRLRAHVNVCPARGTAPARAAGGALVVLDRGTRLRAR